MNLAKQPRDDADMKRKLERALVSGGNAFSLGDVGLAIKQGRAQWWCNGDAAIVTEIMRHPQRWVLNYWLVAGELNAALSMQPDIDAWAINEGCDAAIATGRRGWTPLLKEWGWRVHAIEYAKPLMWLPIREESDG
jgi:hypothetical protein